MTAVVFSSKITHGNQFSKHDTAWLLCSDGGALAQKGRECFWTHHGNRTNSNATKIMTTACKRKKNRVHHPARPRRHERLFTSYENPWQAAIKRI
jgi:hypothetical protein